MRGAAQGWEKNYTEKLESIGLKAGGSTTAVFYSEKDETRLVVHGDDFTFLGYPEKLKEVEEKMKEWYEIKVRGVLGDDAGDMKKITILNRSIEWTGEKLVYTADDKHARIIIEEMGLKEGSKGLAWPCVKEEAAGEEGEEELSQEESRHFRRVAARANYLGMDRMDIQFAVKEICREMSKPTFAGQRKLKRLARYLVSHPRVEIEFDGEGDEGFIDAFSDSDWAGCRVSRKSTCGGLVAWGGNVMKSWSRTQASVSLSVGEAEYYALTSAAAEAIGFKSLLKDLGVEAKIKVWTDSAAAKSITSRKGIGKIRHLEVKFLWVQEKTRRRELQMKKVAGSENPADILTKPKDEKDIRRLAEKMKVKVT